MSKTVKSVIVIALSALLFLSLIMTVYKTVGKASLPKEHCAYDSYTLQAMAWRRGEAKLDKNYPYLELAIVNREWLKTHGKDDYMAYREAYGEPGEPLDEAHGTVHEGDEYYVSFPPFPSVPMYLLTFFYGENTPSNTVTILCAVGAFVFAIMIGRRLKYGWAASVTGALLMCLASSAFFLAVNKMSGGCWFLAQTMALFLTTASFYFMLGDRDRDFYISGILLAFAVGCRPFQLLYFFFFVYRTAKVYNFKILRTWKFYVGPAIVGGLYMIYNVIRFGNPLEFGHNYLPTYMRNPDGQFSVKYLKSNWKIIFESVPKFTENGLEYSNFGFAFYAANIMVLLVPLGIFVYALMCSVNGRKSLSPRRSETYEPAILLILTFLHLIFLCMHDTLGGWQFGSRYTVDMLPAVLVMLGYLFKPLQDRNAFKKPEICDEIRAVSAVAACAALLFGAYFNIYGAIKAF